MQLKWFTGNYGAVAGRMNSLPACKGFWRACTYRSWTGGVLSSVRNLVIRAECFTQELPIPVHSVSQMNRKIKTLKILVFFLFSLFTKRSYGRMASNPHHCRQESKNKESQVLQIRKRQEGSTSPLSSLSYKFWQCHHCDLEPGGRE